MNCNNCPIFPNKIIILVLLGVFFAFFQANAWGFFAHQRINRLAIFTLPPEMMPFYKQNLQYLMEHSVDPDKRRYAVKEEAPRHFIDLDAYPDRNFPLFWKEAVARYTEDTLALHGSVPYYVQLMKFKLTEAFKNKDVRQILKISAEIGHYIADSNVPLHTTKNYNGQLSGQEGIHGFWESRLPELFSHQYDFFVGKAEFVESPAKNAWAAIWQANACLDSVLTFEKKLSLALGESQKYSIEERNGVLAKNYSQAYSARYHAMLKQQVERQMKASIKMIGDFWLTAWIDAGQPDLTTMLTYKPAEEPQQENQTPDTTNNINLRKEDDGL